MTGSSYTNSHVNEGFDGNANYPKPVDTSPDIAHQPARLSNVYHLADDGEDHTYHELSEPAQSRLSPSGQQGGNTDEDNYYHTLTNDDLDGVPSTALSASGK